MLTGAQLSIAIAAILFTAILIGWLLRWLWVRLAHEVLSDTERIAEMVDRMHAADSAREAAEGAREFAENLLATREAEMDSHLAAREAEMDTRLAEMQTRLDGAIEGREAELTEALREARSDSEVSMSGLQSARARVMELEAELEELRRSD